MSHASATTDTSPARITEAVPARPLLVVERLGHSAGSAVRFTFCAEAAPADAPAFTLCAGPIPANVALTYTFAAQSAASKAVEGDSVVGSWI